jgi:epothilone polyketide synthase D
MRPKAAGAWHLHRLTKDAPLDFFISCSSIAAVWGSAHQAHYAAANAFLDGLADYRQARGMAGMAINWGPWNGAGMSMADGGRRVTENGLRLVDPELALLTFGQLITSSLSRVVVADVDWKRLKDLYQTHGRQPLFDRVGPRAEIAEGETSPLVAELTGLDAAERFARLVPAVESVVADVLRLSGDQAVERDMGFFDMGIDSLMSIQIKDRLQQVLGREFPASLCFDYPTVTTLSRHLLDQLFPASAPQAAPAPAPTRAPAAAAAAAAGDGAIEQMSDEQIAALIDEEMKALNLE